MIQITLTENDLVRLITRLEKSDRYSGCQTPIINDLVDRFKDGIRNSYNKKKGELGAVSGP
jgi:hypothetical protein